MDKIAFICTTHQSNKHRPNGFHLFNQYVESLYNNCEYSFNLYAFDNASEDNVEVDYMPENFKFTRIDNQYRGGLTYTWNLGVKQAIKDKCNIIIITVITYISNTDCHWNLAMALKFKLLNM